MLMAVLGLWIWLNQKYKDTFFRMFCSDWTVSSNHCSFLLHASFSMVWYRYVDTWPCWLTGYHIQKWMQTLGGWFGLGYNIPWRTNSLHPGLYYPMAVSSPSLLTCSDSRKQNKSCNTDKPPDGRLWPVGQHIIMEAQRLTLVIQHTW